MIARPSRVRALHGRRNAVEEVVGALALRPAQHEREGAGEDGSGSGEQGGVLLGVVVKEEAGSGGVAFGSVGR